MTFGVDSWKHSPIEKHYANKPAPSKSYTPPVERAKTALKDKLHGTARCACGCRQTATAFRGGKMYSPGCVGRGSGWDKSGLPQDRTPPSDHGGKRWVPDEK